MAEQPGDLHLRDAEPFADLGLGQVAVEAHDQDALLALGQFLHFVLVFLPLWWIWAGHTIYANRFDTDSRPHRLSTLLIMFLMIVISAQILGAPLEGYLSFFARMGWTRPCS